MQKYKIFPIIFTIFILLTSCLQQSMVGQPKLASITLIDRNGLSETLSGKDRLARYEKVNFLAPQSYQKVMRVFNSQLDGTIVAQITSYHPNGQIKQYLDLVNNRAYGDYREWHENGVLKIEAHVIGGSGDLGPSHEKTWLFEGECKAWDEDGNLEAVICYSKGVQQGFSNYYHKNGMLWKKIPYDKGMIHGVDETYLENGELLQTTEYEAGYKQGMAVRYWPPLQIAAKECFKQGKLESGIYYDQLGNTVSEIIHGEGERALFGKNSIAELHEYKHGELEGKIRVFTENGDLFNMFHIKNGMKHGEDIEYYPKKHKQVNGHQKISIQWYEGQVQGLVKTWYPDGTQESQREMSKNEKNGLATAWYEDGTLMLIEEYENDKLKQGKYFKKGSKLPVSTVRDGHGVATIYDSQGNFLKKINYYYSNPEVN